MSATFTPPVVTGQSGPVDPQARGFINRWFRGDFSRADNVWIVDGTAAQNYQPQSTYNSDGSLNQDGLQRTTAFFQGGATYTVTDAEATILNAAGFPTT